MTFLTTEVDAAGHVGDAAFGEVALKTTCPPLASSGHRPMPRDASLSRHEVEDVLGGAGMTAAVAGPLLVMLLLAFTPGVYECCSTID